MKKKTLINANDKLSRAINLLKGRCEKCSRAYPYQLHWAHVYGRRAKVIRWNPLNWLLLCATCHRWSHENPILFTEWFTGTFGKVRTKELEELLRSTKTITVKDYEKINRSLRRVLEQQTLHQSKQT